MKAPPKIAHLKNYQPQKTRGQQKKTHTPRGAKRPDYPHLYTYANINTGICKHASVLSFRHVFAYVCLHIRYCCFMGVC